MTQEELELLGKHLYANEEQTIANYKGGGWATMAIMATLVDYLRGDIKGLPSPLSNLVRNASYPSPPEDNSDPEPLATSVCKTLGSLGLQSLEDLKGFQYDAQDHILLHVKGRMADSGWLKGDPKLDALGRIMADHRLEFNMLS